MYFYVKLRIKPALYLQLYSKLNYYNKKIMNKTKKHNPPTLQVKWSVPYVFPKKKQT